MNAVQDIPDQEHNGIRDTGFPEPLSHERNTTLPHPSADTSPHASIEASDIPLNRTSSRLRFHRKASHKNKNSGLIDPNHMYDNIVYEDGTVAEKPDLHMYKSSSPDTEDGRVSEEVKEGRGRDEVVMNEGREESREGSKERKKRRFLRRLHKSRDGKD